jgi:uracil-DNA glycosylase
VAKALGVGVVASGDPVLTENPFQSAWITAKDLGEFVQRSSIDGIQTAQINSIEQLAWSGHVYNLQTESNWYIAEGVIAHNCYPGTDEKTGALAEIKTDYIDACRPYVRNVIREFQPTRILAFGTQAIHSLFNRAPGIMAVRRGFSWLLNHHDNRHDCPTWYVNVEGGEQVPWGCRCEPIPVLFLMHPAAACRNRFIKKEWMEDLKWALTTPDDFFRERYIFLRQGRVEEIETVSHTMLALSELEGTCQQFGKPIVIDVETRGKQFNKDFRIISLAMCIAGENHAYVWTAQALRDPDIVRHLVSTFDDENNIWVEQSDYDEVSLVAAWGHKLAGERRDTRLIRRLMEPGIKSDLGTMSERVGMGGYKSDFDDLVDLAIKRCIPKKATRSVKSKSSGGWEPLQVELFDDCPDPEARLAIYEGYKSGDKFFEPRTYAYAIVPTRKTSIYNGQDVISTGLYHEMAWPELRRRKNLAMVWDELSCPSGRSYAQMRIWGIPADKQAITTLIHWAQTQQATAERACRRHLLDTMWSFF